MTSILSEIIPDHDGIITVIKPNETNTRLATGGSDGKINIFIISSSLTEPPSFKTQLIKHFHGILDLSWSSSHHLPHSFLASVSYDTTLIIWEESSSSSLLYTESYSYYEHTSPITSCSFSPYQYGLILLCCSYDGSISMHEYINSKWTCKYKSKCTSSMYTSISFGAAFSFINDEERKMSMRYVTGAQDGKVVEWIMNEDVLSFRKNVIAEDVGYVESVDWLKVPTREEEIIAVGLNKGSVMIYKKGEMEEKWRLGDVICVEDDDEEEEDDDDEEEERKKEGMKRKDEINVKVGWSLLGSMLVVCVNGYKLRYYEENLDEKWEEVFI